MLARLRREFVAITMALVGLVLIAALGSTLVSSVTTQDAVTSALLKRALAGEGWAVAQIGDETGQQSADIMLAVTVDVTFDGSVLDRSSSPVSIPEQTLYDVIGEALSTSAAQGKSADYPIAWMRARTVEGWRIALVDTYSRDAALRSQAMTDLVVFAVAMGALFVAVSQLARWVLRPVEEAWERQRRFISDASHELKTPLAVIIANTQILSADEGLADDARRWVESTAEEAGHMKGLVEDLLTLARADEQRAEGAQGLPRSEDVDLTALVSGCALEFDAVAFERGCRIECELAPGVRTTGDPSQLGRVARTLLDNATKYARRDTAVRVALAPEGRRALLTVTNQGEPIAPEDLGRLFDRFYRTDRARERQAQGGFGLGLAIAKSIVEAHGGRIWAESDAEHGTTFSVLL